MRIQVNCPCCGKIINIDISGSEATAGTSALEQKKIADKLKEKNIELGELNTEKENLHE